MTVDVRDARAFSLPDRGLLASCALRCVRWIGGLVLLWSAPATGADCVPAPARVVEFELIACQPADVAIAERIAGADLWWLRPYLESVALGNPGVVLRGRALRFHEGDQGATILPWEEGDGLEEQVFYTSSDPDFCGAFDGLEALTLVREEPCCEIVPPANVACVLDVAEVRPVREDSPVEFHAPPVGSDD